MSHPCPIRPSSDPILHRFDLLQVGLAAARAAATAGDATTARREVLAAVRRRLGGQEAPTNVPAGNLEQAEGLLQRRLALLNYPTVDLAEPIDWLMMRDRDDQWTQHLGYFKWSLSLARAWRSTGRVAFAQAWRGYVADLLDNAWYGRPDWPSDPSRPRVEIGRRVSDNGEATQWNSLAVATRTDVLLDGLALVLDSGVVDDELLLACLDALWRDGLLCLVNNPRTNTPNQYLHTGQALLRLGLALPEHVNASAACELGLVRLRDALARQVLPDGSDLEQSPNYNYGILRLERQLRSLLPTDLQAPFTDAARRRLRFLTTLHYPDGHQVEIAKSGYGADQRPILAEFAAELGVPAELAVPGAAHPWGGWYALKHYQSNALVRPEDSARSAWGVGRSPAATAEQPGEADNEPVGSGSAGLWPSTSYLLLKACGPGAGHVHEDSLSCVLWSNGRRLLIDSGNFSYGSSTDLDRRMNSYSRDGRSHSGVLVDGHGPRRIAVQNALRGELWEEPRQRADRMPRLGNRALAGQRFALVEGSYDDGHGDGLTVRHRRRILQVAGLGWLVLDLLDPIDEAEHGYTQLWQLPPEAAGTVVIADGTVSTPALRLRAMPPAQPIISLLVGSEDPVGGWYFPTYGQRQPKPDVHVTWRGRGRQLAATWLADAGMPAVQNAQVQRTTGQLSLELSFADGQSLVVAAAAEAIPLAVGGITERCELMALLGNEAVVLGASEAPCQRELARRDGAWIISTWPSLPEVTP